MISVRINHVDLLKVQFALSGVAKQMDIESNSWPKRCATLFVYDVTENLLTQKFSAGYPPLSESYTQKKAYLGYPAGFWRYTGSLLMSLRPFKIGTEGWAGGVPPGTPNSRGQDITTYGLMLETGGTNSAGKTIPARPLFTPTLGEFRNTKAKKEVERSKQNIKQRWR